MKRVWILAFVLAAGAAQAQPFHADAASCLNVDTTPGALLDPPTAAGELEAPIPWTDFVIEGTLIDPPSTVHALLFPTMDQHRTDLSPRTLRDVAKLIGAFGYQLESHQVRGTQLVLRLAPLPIVRKVDVDTHQGLFERPLDEEIRRRMILRTGAYLPLDEKRRKCAIWEEETRIEDYLKDEGFFDAKADFGDPKEKSGDKGLRIHVNVDLGPEYTLDPPQVILPEGFTAVSKAEVRKLFVHRPTCIFFVCVGTTRFTRTQHQQDLQDVRQLFNSRQYPAARVQSSFDPTTSVMHGSKLVKVAVTIDPRRRLQVDFQGVDMDENGIESLRKQLTFDSSGSTDDVEAAASARALETFFQQHYRFDARVTIAPRERTEDLDHLTFVIDQGPHRELRGIEFVCNGAGCPRGHKPFDSEALSGIIATKKWDYVSDLIGTQVAATSNEIAADQDRLREAYRRAGYRDMQVGVTVSPIPIGAPQTAPPSAAVVAAMAEAQSGEGLYVRYTIDEGEPTLLTRIELEAADEVAAQALASGLCKQLLRELASELGVPKLEQTDAKRCVATIAGLPFREDDVALTKDRLRDFLFKQGRLRSNLEYEARVLEPHRIEAHYTVRTIGERKLGKIVVRGNFRTRNTIIARQLDFREGQLLTSDVLADGARRLRSMGMFDAVNIDLVDLDAGEQSVDAVVHIEERYDNLMQFELQGGYSSYNGFFGTVAPSIQNVLGVGASITATLTRGEKIQDYEGKVRAPKWLFGAPSIYKPNVELTGLYLEQDTPAFGLLTTEGATLASTWVDPRQRTATDAARIIAVGTNYSYRLRTRNIDALRPIGADMDQRQVAVPTETGSVGVTLDIDQRVDRRGQLSPLAPESGYRVYGSVSYAFPQLATWVGGQYTFIKTSASGSYFLGLGDNLVIRGDLRYDQGFPLGGAALLPEVERFFAGGDNTVRGYQDDQLATEIVQIGVPPLAGVSQIRVFPAGGDIRVLSSLDAQYRIWKIVAGAVFTDAGMIANDWRLVTVNDIRPSVGMGVRFLTPFGIGAIEYAVPIQAHLGDDPRGRIHFYFAARAQF